MRYYANLSRERERILVSIGKAEQRLKDLRSRLAEVDKGIEEEYEAFFAARDARRIRAASDTEKWKAKGSKNQTG